MLFGWLICWVVDWLVGWLVGWLIDWLLGPYGAAGKSKLEELQHHGISHLGSFYNFWGFAYNFWKTSSSFFRIVSVIFFLKILFEKCFLNKVYWIIINHTWQLAITNLINIYMLHVLHFTNFSCNLKKVNTRKEILEKIKNKIRFIEKSA